jgi:hypothetical protein
MIGKAPKLSKDANQFGGDAARWDNEGGAHKSVTV